MLSSIARLVIGEAIGRVFDENGDEEEIASRLSERVLVSGILSDKRFFSSSFSMTISATLEPTARERDSNEFYAARLRVDHTGSWDGSVARRLTRRNTHVARATF